MTTAIETAYRVLLNQKLDCVKNESLKKHSSFKIGGKAAIFCTPQTIGQLRVVIGCARLNALPLFFLGQGTNVLFEDEGYEGVIVFITDALGKIEIDRAAKKITAGAGVVLADVCKAAQQVGFSGLEFAYGIPGSVGGAVYMNAGAYGGETGAVLESVVYLNENLQIIVSDINKLGLSYRYSVFQKKPWCILSATYKLQTGNAVSIKEKMDDYMQRRIDKQPLEMPSAGSFFKRPKNGYASALIDECGLRGYRVGDAAISEKHCGFVVNLGNATCADVLKLANNVGKIVRLETHEVLKKEIKVIRTPKTIR